MSLFLITREPEALNNGALSAVLQRKFTSEVYRLGKGQWIVAAPYDSAQKFSLEAGIGAGKPYTGTLVVQIQSYYGLHDQKVWDWIKARF